MTVVILVLTTILLRITRYLLIKKIIKLENEKNKLKIKVLIGVYFVFSIVFFILLCLGMWQLNKHYKKALKKI